MSPEVLEAKFDALREDIAELKIETREGLKKVNTTLTSHNGRLRKVEVEQIKEEARAQAENERTERFARYKVPIVTTSIAAPIAALLTLGATALVTGGPS